MIESTPRIKGKVVEIGGDVAKLTALKDAAKETNTQLERGEIRR